MSAAFGAGDLTSAGGALAPAVIRQQAILGNTISLDEIMAAHRPTVRKLEWS